MKNAIFDIDMIRSIIRKNAGGMMSNSDITEAIMNREMIITPFDEQFPDRKRLTPAGFNFSFTRFIISMNKKMFFKIYESATYDRNIDELYFLLEPGDTALALTYESIWVSKKFAGTFHSKVGYVSQGLGHISTTLDPGWMGQLLISINNPNTNSIHVVIGKRDKRNNLIEYNSFITLCLYRLISPATALSDNSCARLDILYDILAKNSTSTNEMNILKNNINKLRNIIDTRDKLHPYRFNEKNPTPDEVQTFKNDHMELLKSLDDLQPDIERVINAE